MVGDGDDYHDEGGFRSKAMFFFHTLFSAESHAGPPKILRVGKRFLYWPVTRYAQSTKSPEINLTAREVDWAWWSQGAAR